MKIFIFFICMTTLALANETPNWKVEKIPANRDSIYGTINGLPGLQPGDPIAVFDAEGDCYGTGEFDGTHFWLSMFMAEEPDPSKPGDITVPGFKPGDEVVFKAYSKKENKEYALKPSSGEPYLYEPHGAFPPTELNLVYGTNVSGSNVVPPGDDVVPPYDDVTPPEGDSTPIDEETVSGSEQAGSIIIATKPKTEEGAEETEKPKNRDGSIFLEKNSSSSEKNRTVPIFPELKEASQAMPKESEHATLEEAPPARLKLEGRKPLSALGAELPVIKALVHMPLAAKVFLFIIIPVLLIAAMFLVRQEKS